MVFHGVLVVVLIVSVFGCWNAFGEESWPALPTTDGEVSIPAQEWTWQPGPRTVKVYVRYPKGSVEGVDSESGVMLSLHNWGGTGFVGTADPAVLVSRYNVVAIGVDYLQSGQYDPERDGPYDFGWLQALDALRALYFVRNGLDAMAKPFDHGRIFAVGGSGGGNVALMANKLAPRTFACVIDLSGMAELSDDVAFGVPGKTHLNAGYSRDPKSPRYLSPDAQALRVVGYPDHARLMKELGNTAKTVVVHGVKDDACSFDDAREMVEGLLRAGLDVEPHFIAKSDIDGAVIKDCKHSLGDRTRILQRFADGYLLPGGNRAARRSGKTDFECRDERVRYKTPNGSFTVSYVLGFPVGRFDANSSR